MFTNFSLSLIPIPSFYPFLSLTLPPSLPPSTSLTADFMVPARDLEDDENEFEDDLSTISGSTANYGGFSSFRGGSTPSSRSPSPDMSFLPDGNAAAAATWRGDRQTSAELHLSAHKTLPHNAKNPMAMRKSGSYDLVAVRRQRATTAPSKEPGASLSRKPAMGGERKKDMEELRRKVVEKRRAAELQKSAGIEIQRTPSPTLGVEPVKMKRSRSNDLPVMNPRLSPILGSTSPHPHIKVVVATPPTSPDPSRAEPRPGSPLMGSIVASESSSKGPASGVSQEVSPAPSQPEQQQQQQAVEGRRRKPVPSPRRKQPSPDPEPHQKQHTAQDGEEPSQLVAETRKYATIEREKPSAAPRRRTGSLDKEKKDKEKIREYRSATLERKPKGGRAPEPQPLDIDTANISSKRATVGESKSAFSAVFPAEVNSELKSAIALSKKGLSAEEEDPHPHLKEIGKTVSITSEGSVDSQQGSGEGVVRADSGSSGEYNWKRQRARRVVGRNRHANHTEVDEEEHSPRSRTRSGAVSAGANRRSRQQVTEDDDEQRSSRPRTRTGAVSGGDAPVFRRGRNARVSPRPTHHSGAGADSSFPIEEYGSEEAESIRRARVADRRVGRTGGDLLVATDGEQRD